MTSGAEQAAAAARAADKSSSKKPKSPSIFGGVLSAVFSKETGMAKYSKLIGGIVGYAAGFLISWAVAKGLGTCLNPADTNTCTVLGMHSADLSDFILGILTLAGVYIAPPNSPIIK